MNLADPSTCDKISKYILHPQTRERKFASIYL